MKNKESILTLYRVCSERDHNNGYILNSFSKEKLSGTKALQEMISHELNASTARNILYSFTFDLSLAKAYKLRNPENAEICRLDVNLADMSKSIINIYPVFSRDYLMSLMACIPELLKKGSVINPATLREHSILGILNTSQRSISGWAYGMKEIMLQCDNLKLEVFDEKEYEQQNEETVNRLIREHLFPKVTIEGIKQLRDIISSEYERCKCKRRYILDRITDVHWAKLA